MFTAILIIIAILNLLVLLVKINNTPAALFHAGMVDRSAISRSLWVTGGLLLWAAYRLWG